MHAVDLSRDRGPPMLGTILLTAGVLAAVSALAHRQHQLEALAEVDRRSQAQLELQRQQIRPVRAMTPSPAETRMLAAAVESRAPWLATLRTIESTAREPVFLRAASIEPGAGLVKLEAEASSFAEALAYAKELDESEILHPAWLRSHEQVAGPIAGKPVVRFVVIARWNRR